MNPKDSIFLEYVKVTTLFEAARDAGLWHIRWTITDQEPRSDRIWNQWAKAKGPFNHAITAEAECDEISALFAFLCRKMGVKGVGLFWPCGNHTVAVWKLKSRSGGEVRIVVPTTQIFLTAADGFGTRGFDPRTQASIYDYTREDVGESFKLPASLARFLVLQVRRYGFASGKLLQQLRCLRENALTGAASAEEFRSRVAALKAEHGGEDDDLGALEYFESAFQKR